MLKNYMEDMVNNALPKILDQHEDMCRCAQCMADVKAMALNNLKPLYFASNKGGVYNKLKELEIQFSADIAREITKAIEIVSNNPYHD
ncbi:MAG: late competence development ComFB family protein [Clostridiales bacterium]|nr:late competence development ComFB family protein [Clostridiales bacterium]